LADPKKDCLLPRRVLMQIFRGKMRPLLLKALDTGWDLYSNRRGADQFPYLARNGPRPVQPTVEPAGYRFRH